jgi:hypothetical protein
VHAWPGILVSPRPANFYLLLNLSFLMRWPGILVRPRPSIFCLLLNLISVMRWPGILVSPRPAIFRLLLNLSFVMVPGLPSSPCLTLALAPLLRFTSGIFPRPPPTVFKRPLVRTRCRTRCRTRAQVAIKILGTFPLPTSPSLPPPAGTLAKALKIQGTVAGIRRSRTSGNPHRDRQLRSPTSSSSAHGTAERYSALPRDHLSKPSGCGRPISC